eukprot:11180286-Lingulodinium_polyedra.AAC.1
MNLALAIFLTPAQTEAAWALVAAQKLSQLIATQPLAAVDRTSFSESEEAAAGAVEPIADWSSFDVSTSLR